MNLTFTYFTTWSNCYHEYLVEGHQSDKCLFETQPHLSLMLCTLAMCVLCTTCSQGACGGPAWRPVSLGTHHSSILHCDSLGLASRHWNDVLEMLGLIFDFCLSSFPAICSQMAAVTILTSLVCVNQHPTITSKSPKWVCVSATLSLHWQLVLIFGQCRCFATQTQNHPVTPLLTDFLCLCVECS